MVRLGGGRLLCFNRSHEYLRARVHAGQDRSSDLSMFVLAITGVIFVVVVYFAGLRGREVPRPGGGCRPRTGAGVRKHADRTGLDDHSGPDRRRPVSGDGAGDPRDPGRSQACDGSRRHRHRASILVGIPVSEARHRHGKRAAHSGERSRASHADIPEAAVGRHRPQLLDSANSAARPT